MQKKGVVSGTMATFSLSVSNVDRLRLVSVGVRGSLGAGLQTQQVLVVGALSGKASGFVWDRPTPGVI